MKKILYIGIGLLFLLPFSVHAKDVTLHLFYRDGCPHCAKEEEYLKDINDKYPDLKIEKYEVWNNSDNASLMNNVGTTLDKTVAGVPFTVIGTYSIIGFNEYTETQIEKYIDVCYEYGCSDLVTSVKSTGISLQSDFKDRIETANINLEKYENKKENNGSNSKDKDKNTNEETINLPIIGDININSTSAPLLLISVVMGLVDGFNPCAMWILIFLISMMLGMKNRKRMWILGFLFLFTSALIYFLFMVAWLKVLLSVSQIKIINIIIALVALIGGSINVRSYLKERKEASGCQVVNDKKRKSIISKVKKLTTEKSFVLAVFGIIGLAVSVNFVELLCSAGLPTIFIKILSANNINSFSYYGYILIYIIFYLLDDIIVFTIAMITLKITGLTNKYNKYSHLIGGIIMLIIGILLIIKPELLLFGN